MSTLQNTSRTAVLSHTWQRIALAALIAGVAAALAIVFLVARGDSSNAARIVSPPATVAHPSQAALQRQLDAVAGARYGVQQHVRAAGSSSTAAMPTSPARLRTELEGSTGPRFGQPGGYNPR